MTKARKAISGILEGADEPLSAGDILRRMDCACDIATVYRSLRFLEQKGLADSFAMHCPEHGTERYYMSRRAGLRHWFHCERCHGFVDLGECGAESLLRAMESETGVDIRKHVMYATGLCARCRSTQMPRKRA